MRIGLDDKIEQQNKAQSDGLADMIKETSDREETKFSDLSGKKKAQYIWDYYKWWFIGALIVIVLAVNFVKDWRENSKPVYLYVEMINTYLGADPTNTVYDDFVKEAGIDLSKERFSLGTETTLLNDKYDTTMIAFQQRLVANYAAGTLDVLIGPKSIMEGAANCGNYARFDEVVPKELMEELVDRDYELYYFDPAADEIEDYEGEDLTPYCAGIYLDNCSYLNNMGQNGAYPVATKEDDRVIFTIAANSQRIDHAVEFLRFIACNR